MSLAELQTRAGEKCELCAGTTDLAGYEVQPSDGSADKSILACATCSSQIENADSMDANHWRCLNGSMWSEHAPVQVMAWRILSRLSSEGWAQDLKEQLYLDEANLAWAEAGTTDTDNAEDSGSATKDSNGAQLHDGDSVTLIKDLDVKGANFTAKRGTLVKNISLTANPEHIEGRVVRHRGWGNMAQRRRRPASWITRAR